MRTLDGHKVNGANEQLTINVLDEPGHGGACHEYSINGFESSGPLVLKFQDGPIAEVGVNGVTHEVLLAILIDRLEGFQRGNYANPHNEDALKFLQAAQTALHTRTRERIARGVEGTHEQ